jgi:hypothetical protein
MIEQGQLGCKAADLEIGTEFSCDEGRSWLVVRTEPRYVSEAVECLTLRFMASPGESTSLSTWEEVRLEDSDHVLLERSWKG